MFLKNILQPRLSSSNKISKFALCAARCIAVFMPKPPFILISISSKKISKKNFNNAKLPILTIKARGVYF